MNNVELVKKDHLTLARKRGLAYANKEFHSVENLTLGMASQVSRQSPELICMAQNHGLLCALYLQGRKQDWHSPIVTDTSARRVLDSQTVLG